MDTENRYERALEQLDELIGHFRSSGETACSVAEQEDVILIRLADLRADLKPDDIRAIDAVARFYGRHIGNDGKNG